jgi:ribosome-associated protein
MTAIDTRDQLLKCATLAAEKKALQLRALDVRELAGFTDYFLICSGSSDRQVTAIAETIHETMKHDGLYPVGTEGVTDGRWALIDYGDFVVHVFLDSVREFYNFDRLWGAAPEIPLPETE